MSHAQEIMDRAIYAAAAFRLLDQKQTDQIVRAVYLAALDQRIPLAKLAQEETGLGIWEDKVIKNVIATQLVYEDIKDRKTVGVIYENPRLGIVEVAQPVGPILGTIPVTNPTSTTIFKSLIAMKSRNPLILSAHPAAQRSTASAAEICYRAALGAGAPEHCIQWIKKSSSTVTELMSHPRMALILATGTHEIVRRAYSSGTPTIGVGPGNVPAFIGVSADIPFAVRSIVESKTFDYGTICASEQAVVVRTPIAQQVIDEFKKHQAYFMSPDEIAKVGKVAFDPVRGVMSAGIVGQSPEYIARSAGIDIPAGTRLLIAPLEGVGRDYPLSAEILAPILAFYIVDDFDTAILRCTEITRFGGEGHTAVIYSNKDERIEYFSHHIDAGRILVNIPSTFGAIGGTENTLNPSFTLTCGSGANNSSTDNITARHLLNIHRITRRRPNPLWKSFDQRRYMNESASAEQIEKEYNKNF
ncbi:MAG: aldehyde dehydrogenase family protein [bacterium]|nr:aldehyde dehydrogenase family protein [bacterium]